MVAGQSNEGENWPGFSMALTRWLYFLTLMVFVGGFTFGALILVPLIKHSELEIPAEVLTALQKPFLRFSLWSWVVLLVTALFNLLFKAAAMAGTSLLGAANGEILRAVISSSQYGRMWALGIVVTLVSGIVFLAVSEHLDGSPGNFKKRAFTVPGNRPGYSSLVYGFQFRTRRSGHRVESRSFGQRCASSHGYGNLGGWTDLSGAVDAIALGSRAAPAGSIAGSGASPLFSDGTVLCFDHCAHGCLYNLDSYPFLVRICDHLVRLDPSDQNPPGPSAPGHRSGEPPGDQAPTREESHREE